MSEKAQPPRTATPVRISTKPAAGLRVRDPAVGETRTACIRTFGCQMNVHDSDRMRRMILDAGYAEVHTYEEADLVILNTCYVRENAVDRVRGHLGELGRLKREGRVKRVALTGYRRCARPIRPNFRAPRVSTARS
jgi:tRNA-2-methylthio-N6-dimethylallyladenosine synthase